MIERKQVKILKCFDDDLDERLEEEQDEGWRVAGDVSIKPLINSIHTFVLIPMSRKEWFDPNQSKKND